MAYFCIAKPCEPNNVVIEQEKATENNTGTAKTVGPEFYLCEITTFYERVITILSIIIGLILGLNFLYIHHTSRKQAEDMARDALKDESFRISLDDLIKKRFTEARDQGPISEIFEVLDELDGRIRFLEKAITEKSYDSLDEGPQEKAPGKESGKEN
jgi:hypothetical protein